MGSTRYTTRALLLAVIYACGCLAHPALPYGFNVVWNVPAHGCEGTRPLNLSQYSVLTNANDTWYEKIKEAAAAAVSERRLSDSESDGYTKGEEGMERG
jgi:hypothetical protein